MVTTHYVQKRREEERKNTEKEKNVRNEFLSSCPSIICDQELFIILVFEMNRLHKLYYHVCYAMAYYHKKFQNLNIGTRTVIACLN